MSVIPIDVLAANLADAIKRHRKIRCGKDMTLEAISDFARAFGIVPKVTLVDLDSQKPPERKNDHD